VLPLLHLLVGAAPSCAATAMASQRAAAHLSTTDWEFAKAVFAGDGLPDARGYPSGTGTGGGGFRMRTR
jgi:hypothetical protein